LAIRQAGYIGYAVPGCSSAVLSISTRKVNPPNLNEYLENASPQIELERCETFGNCRKFTGPIKFEGLRNQ
jgi:hypothetical protein